MKKRIVCILAATLLGGVLLLLFDLFILHPSGVYIFSKGQAYGFKIGMTKTEALATLIAINDPGVQLLTRAPYHMQTSINRTFEMTPELEKSNYWTIESPRKEDIVLSFRSEKLWRILGQLRRFGELEGVSELFYTPYPTESVWLEFQSDVFEGLSETQADERIKKASGSYRTFFRR